MPSGSHGGGGGSHFGGGGFSGGSHFGGSSFGRHSYNGPRRPGRAPIHFHFFYWGGRRYAMADDDRSKISMFLFGCLFCLLFMIVWGMTIPSSISNIKQIQADYTYYQDMITYAETHTELLIEGTIQTTKYNYDAEKYYVEYYFLDQDGERVDGYTYCIYTYEQAKAFHTGDTIQLAVDGLPLTQHTDSVNIDYKDTTLDDDGEYAAEKKMLISSIVIEIVMVGVLALLVVFTVKAIKNNIQKVETDENGQTKMKQKYVCTYCGAKLSEDEKSCPKCGSSTIETITEKNEQ